MKRPEDVGRDFDEYAKAWAKGKYGMESGWSRDGLGRDASQADEVVRPGDEWGETGPLRVAYGLLVERFVAPTGPISVLEIGAGGGRATQVLLDVLGDRRSDYHVVDVADAFVDVLRERIEHPLKIHIVSDVDLSDLPDNHFDLVLSQSAWSHISLYDQYRYLRDLRAVMKPGAPIFINGQFILGAGNDWAWNRFRRRVHQIDNSIEGVYHEMTGVAATAEMLTRLGYDIGCIMPNGFLARRVQGNAQHTVNELQGPLTFPYCPKPHEYLRSGRTRTYELPWAGVPLDDWRADGDAQPMSIADEAQALGRRLVRGAMRRVRVLRNRIAQR